MGKKPVLSEIDKMLAKGKDFELTDAQYEKLTGKPLPKNKYYLSNSSAIAQHAKKNDYCIEVIEKKIILKKKKGTLK